MRISPLIIPKNLIGIDKNQKLNLKIGEILTAKILKNGDGYAFLDIKGQKVLAKLKTELSPGDTVKMRVTGEVQNKFMLKILFDENRSNSVDSLLTGFGIEPDDDSRASLIFLLKNNLPVSPNILKALTTDSKTPLIQVLIKFFETLFPTETKTISSDEILFKAPYSKGFTNNLESIFENNADIKDLRNLKGKQNNQPENLLQKINSANSSFLEKESQVNNQFTGSIDSKTGKILKSIINSQLNLLEKSEEKEQIFLKNDQPKQALDKRTLDKIDPEERKNLLVSQKKDNSNQTAKDNMLISVLKKLSGINPKEPSTLKNIPNDKTNEASTFKKLSSSFINPDGKIHDAKNTGLNNFHSLGRTLFLLEKSGLLINPKNNPENIIKNIKLFTEQMELKQDTEINKKESLLSLIKSFSKEDQKEVIREIIDKFLSIHLKQKDENTILYLEIPLLFDQPSTGILEIKKEARKNHEEFEKRPLHILFNLDIKPLGKLKIFLLLNDKEATFQFSAQEENTRRLLRKKLPDLKKRLEERSYQIIQMNVLPLKEDENETEFIFNQVDFRV